MHPAYQIPDRVAALEEFLQGAVGFGKLCLEGLAHKAPQRAENLGGEVFCASHDRRRVCQPRQFRKIVCRRPGRRAVLVTALGSAEGGDETSSEIPPPGKYRRKNRPCVVHAKREQAVSASPSECALKAFGPACIQNAAVIGSRQRQCAVRRQNQGELDHDRVLYAAMSPQKTIVVNRPSFARHCATAAHSAIAPPARRASASCLVSTAPLTGSSSCPASRIALLVQTRFERGDAVEHGLEIRRVAKDHALHGP